MLTDPHALVQALAARPGGTYRDERRGVPVEEERLLQRRLALRGLTRAAGRANARVVVVESEERARRHPKRDGRGEIVDGRAFMEALRAFDDGAVRALASSYADREPAEIDDAWYELATLLDHAQAQVGGRQHVVGARVHIGLAGEPCRLRLDYEPADIGSDGERPLRAVVEAVPVVRDAALEEWWERFRVYGVASSGRRVVERLHAPAEPVLELFDRGYCCGFHGLLFASRRAPFVLFHGAFC